MVQALFSKLCFNTGCILLYALYNLQTDFKLSPMKPSSNASLLICCVLTTAVWGQEQQSEAEQTDGVASISDESSDAGGDQEILDISAERAPIETSAVERATRPVATWVEERLQNSSLLQPSALSRERTEPQVGELSLREAILLAREEFSGSVLSADRISDEEGSRFSIRILSETGVLRTIDIEAQPVQQAEPEIGE